MLQYTDGLNESMNENREQFKLDRIVDLANAHGSEGAESLVGRLVRAEAAFRGSAPQSDDLTLLAVSVDGGRKSNPPGGNAPGGGEELWKEMEATRDVVADN
jgi:sigma-B regulation protein RsbU (phosphoserine phosphatase)